jgi:hypothetical protein
MKALLNENKKQFNDASFVIGMKEDQLRKLNDRSSLVAHKIKV